MIGAAIAGLWLEIAVPQDFPARETASAVVCRGRDGKWGAIRWRTDATPPSRVEGQEGARCRVLVRTGGSAMYFASRELQWTKAASPVRIDAVWLRTVEAAPVAAPVQWLGAERDDGTECESGDQTARCLFVPASAAGVMTARGSESILFAIIGPRSAGRVVWSGTRWARVVRVHSPSGQPVTARAVTLERAIKQGAGQLLEARAAPSVSIASISANALWIDGDLKGGFLDLRSVGAAAQRLPLEDVLSPLPSVMDVTLRVEEVIQGDVRARGRVAEGATVIVSRIISGDKPGKEHEGYERIGEQRIDSTGTFRFDGLAHEGYELLAVHPELGRARITVTPPAFPRLVLKPRATIRGRVIENGIPVPGARLQMLPSLEAVRAARNPLLLATEAASSGPDGRFELIAPDEGLVMLSISTGRSTQRIDLGDAAALAEFVDLGEIRLEEPREIDVVAELPQGCVLRAAGPMGVAGLSVVSLAQSSPGRWRFLPPASGRWLFAAVCGREELPLDPAVVDLRPGHRDPILLKVRRRPVYF